MRRNRFCAQFLLKRIPNIHFLKQLEGWGKGQSKQILYLRVFPWRNKSGCPTSKRLGICNHQRKWVVTYQQNLSHLHLHVSPIPFLVVLLSKLQTLGWCLWSNYFTNTNLGHMASRKTLWRKQSTFNCNGSKSVQQPLELLQMTKEGERNCASFLYLGWLGSLFSLQIEFIIKADFGILNFS